MTEKLLAVGNAAIHDPKTSVAEWFSEILSQAVQHGSDLIEFDVQTSVNGIHLLMEFRVAIRGLDNVRKSS